MDSAPHGVVITQPSRAPPTSLVTAGQTLGKVYDWTFLLGQSLMPVINALCLGSVMYRSGLVPRIIPAVGLLGAPLLLASDIAVFAGAYERDASLAALGALPIAAWEFSLGVWLTASGAFLHQPLQPQATLP